MSYENHRVFEAPQNLDARIWRYTSFTKFVSFLHTRSLYFARADLLGDPFEGSVSKANIALRPHYYGELSAPGELTRTMSYATQQLVRFTYINCWHMSEHESAAMWSLYAQRGEGIAIRTTFHRLTQSFRVGKKTPVYVGRVKYIDYDSESLPEGNTMYPFVYKRKSFEHEHEIRAVVQKPPSVNGVTDFNAPSPDGKVIKVDVATLVEGFFVAPYAQQWFVDLVRATAHRYRFKAPVRQSSLDSDPVY